MIKDIKGYQGLYAITDQGNVWSYSKIGNKIGKWLTPGKDKNGYLYVNLSKENVMHTYKIHKLVADAFLPEDKNKNEIDHIDRNKLNNSVSNLQRVTMSQNCINSDYSTQARKKAREKSYEAHKRKVLCIETNAIYDSIKEASIQTGIIRQSIGYCCKGKTKTAGGYHWEYVGDSNG